MHLRATLPINGHIAARARARERERDFPRGRCSARLVNVDGSGQRFRAAPKKAPRIAKWNSLQPTKSAAGSALPRASCARPEKNELPAGGPARGINPPSHPPPPLLLSPNTCNPHGAQIADRPEPRDARDRIRFIGFDAAIGRTSLVLKQETGISRRRDFHSQRHTARATRQYLAIGVWYNSVERIGRSVCGGQPRGDRLSRLLAASKRDTRCVG